MSRMIEKFLNTPQKSITLMGMSGAGKSYLSNVLRDSGWHKYACDKLLGNEYMSDAIAEVGATDPKNIGILNAYIGQVGNPELGGIPLSEFKRRQNLHYTAECAVVRDAVAAMDNAGDVNFVNDTSGSLCELDDDSILDALGEKSLFVYLKFKEDQHEELVRRAIEHPKSLYYPAALFDEYLQRYMDENAMSVAEDIAPEEFVRWVFPHLFAARLPKYQALADRYGVTIPAEKFQNITSEDEVIQIVNEACHLATEKDARHG